MATTGNFQKGSTGEEVINIQKGLEFLGYNVGKIDGIFGEMTKTAVMKFQTDHKLAVDGIYGPKTGEKLREVFLAKVEAQKQAAAPVKGAPAPGAFVKGAPLVKGVAAAAAPIKGAPAPAAPVKGAPPVKGVAAPAAPVKGAPAPAKAAPAAPKAAPAPAEQPQPMTPAELIKSMLKPKDK
ncbi:MAG: peptidoglycan-binding protein [Bradymonadales bacterium]|nr:peptidoglycan-binding protein [Bradymonadales bacterium]